MHKAKCSLLVMFLLSSIVSLNTNFGQAAGTNLPSIISSDTTLTQNGGPYSLVGPTRVNAGVTLTLDAGSTLNIGTYYLQVEGTLRSTASSSNPAKITSTLGTDMSSPVGYINFTSSSTNCIIENTIITQTRIYAYGSDVKINSNTINFQGSPSVDNAAIFLYSGTATITSNTINAAIMTQGGTSTISGNTITGGMGLYGGSTTVTNNKVSGHDTYIMFAEDEYRLYNTIAVRGDCSVVISNNEVKGSIHVGESTYFYGSARITGNSVNGGISGVAGQGKLVITSNKVFGSIATAGSNTAIQSNQISGSEYAGISLSTGAVAKYNSVSGFNVGLLVNKLNSNSSSPTIKNNNIQNWTQYSIKTETSTDVDATSNWWGTTDIQTISQSIYDQTHDFNLGKVTITPILNAPDPTAPEILPVQASPTPTVTDASPTPTTPEFSTMAFLVLLIAATLATIVGIRKLKGNAVSIKTV